MRSGLHLAAGALALALLAGPVAAEDAFVDVAARLRRAGPTDAPAAGELPARLAALGEPAVHALYELATGRGLERFGELDWNDPAWLCRPEDVPAVSLEALVLGPRAAVLAELERALGDEPNEHERALQLRLAGRLGSSEALAFVVRGAGALGDLELQRPRVQAELRAAFVEILRRDPRAYPWLDERFDALEPATALVLVDALGAAEGTRGMPLLVRAFESDRFERGRVLEAMVALECARPWSLAGRSARYCATFLRSPEATERARAARLAGELHELELVPDVIALLEDGELAVRRSAEGALARMAGVPLGAEAAAWEAWHERELDWRDTRWSELLATLVGARAGPANEALRELARHPLFRHEVARALAESLPEQPSTVALASCVELENIGSRWAVPGLVSALERGPAQLKAAAWRTLRALSGEARELSLAVWRAWVDS